MKGTEKQIKWAEQIKTKNFVEYPIKKEEGNRRLATIIVPSLSRLTKADQERDKIRSEWESESTARVAICELAGWCGKGGKATPTGKRIAKTEWGDLSPAAKKVLIKHGIKK